MHPAVAVIAGLAAGIVAAAPFIVVARRPNVAAGLVAILASFGLASIAVIIFRTLAPEVFMMTSVVCVGTLLVIAIFTVGRS